MHKYTELFYGIYMEKCIHILQKNCEQTKKGRMLFRKPTCLSEQKRKMLFPFPLLFACFRSFPTLLRNFFFRSCKNLMTPIDNRSIV